MENNNNNTNNTNNGAKRAHTGLEGSVWAPGNSSTQPAQQARTEGGNPHLLSVQQAGAGRENPLLRPFPVATPLDHVQTAASMSGVDPVEQAHLAIDIALFRADQARREAEFSRTLLNRAHDRQVPRPGFVVEDRSSEATSSRPRDQRVNPAPWSGPGSIPRGNDRGRSRGRSRGGPVSSGGVQKTQAPKAQGSLAARITAPTQEMKKFLDEIDPSNPVELSAEAEKLKSAEAARARRAATKCGNCGQVGHELADCAHPSIDGYVHGCPFHNTRDHEFGDACPLADDQRPRTRRAILKWAMEKRANRPALACFSDWFVVLRKFMVSERHGRFGPPRRGPWTPDHVWKLIGEGKAPWQGFDYERNDPNKLGFDPLTCNLLRIKENYGILHGLTRPQADSPLEMEIDVATDDVEDLDDPLTEDNADGDGIEFSEIVSYDDLDMLDDESLTVQPVQSVQPAEPAPGPAGDYHLDIEDKVDFGDGNDDFVDPLVASDDVMES